MAPLGGAAGKFANIAQQVVKDQRAERQAQAAALAASQQPASQQPASQQSKTKSKFNKWVFAIIAITIIALLIAGTTMMFDKNYTWDDNKSNKEHIIITHAIFAALAVFITLILTYYMKSFGKWAFLFFIAMAQTIWICFQGYTWGWKKDRFPETGPLIWNTSEQEEAKIPDRTISTYRDSDQGLLKEARGVINYHNTKWYAFMDFTKRYYIDTTGKKKFQDYTPEQFKNLTNTEKADIISFIELPDQFPQSVRTDDASTTDIDETVTSTDIKRLLILKDYGYDFNILKLEDVVEIDGGSKSIPEFVDENEFKSSRQFESPKLFELRKNLATSVIASISVDIALLIIFFTMNMGKKKQVLKQTSSYEPLTNNDDVLSM